MLALTRKVFASCGDENCVVLDLPGGGRVRLWLVRSDPTKPGQVRVWIDAQRDVTVLRGELLEPLETQPDAPKASLE